MPTTFSGTFATRREAEMTVERLVQEHGIERTDIFISAAEDENTAGAEQAGSDGDAGAPTNEARNDAPLNGEVAISVDVGDAAKAEVVRAAFSEFHAAQVEEG